MIFEELPPVLHLHLKRFVWDLYGNAAEKINDRFEFGEHLNLDDFLDQKPDTPADYTLHSVLVHSGVGHGGHYVGFVRPSKDGSWYQFDDETVYEVDQEDAIEGNYGVRLHVCDNILPAFVMISGCSRVGLRGGAAHQTLPSSSFSPLVGASVHSR